MDKEVNELRIDVEVTKKDIDTLTRLCEKMDKVIEKLVDHQDVIIKQIYNDMDRRNQDTNEDIKELHSRITTTSRETADKMDKSEGKIMAEIKDLSNKIQAQTDSEARIVEKLMKYKWPVLAGVIMISWLTSHVGPDIILKMITQMPVK
jgi:cellulose biosynthesis protein BcsQ